MEYRVSRRRVIITGALYGSVFAAAGCGGGGSGSGQGGSAPETVTGGAYTLLNLGANRRVVGLNNRGQVVGHTYEVTETPPASGVVIGGPPPYRSWNRVWLWEPNADGTGGTHRDVTPTGYDSVERYLTINAINEAGQTVGRVYQASDINTNYPPYVRASLNENANPTPTVLNLQSPAGYANAVDITNAGVACLVVTTSGLLGGGPNEPVRVDSFLLYDEGRYLPVTFDPLLNRPTVAYAAAINNRGDVAGHGFSIPTVVTYDAQGMPVDLEGQPAYQTYQAFLYQNGRTHYLGTPDGYQQSFAYGINDAGQVIGAARQVNPRSPLTADVPGAAFL